MTMRKTIPLITLLILFGSGILHAQIRKIPIQVSSKPRTEQTTNSTTNAKLQGKNKVNATTKRTNKREIVPSTAPTSSTSKGVATGTIFDWLATRYVTEADIANHSHELRILRNAIYARHYRKFKDANLRNFFNQFQWYRGERDEIPASELNQYEQYNIQFIQKYE